MLKHLHRTFEGLREDDKRLKRQPFGDDIDIDAVVESFSDLRVGLECGDRGNYGIEDTRKALIEAKVLGIHPYCITIDNEALDYLPHMYGAVNFALIDKVGKLPFKVSETYRRITR